MQRKIKVPVSWQTYVNTPLVVGDVRAYTLSWNVGEDNYGGMLKVSALRADGETVVDADYIPSDGVAVYTLASNMYCIPGELRVRLAVVKNNSVLTDRELVFTVVEGDDEGIDAETQAESYDNLLFMVISAKESATNAKTSEINAGAYAEGALQYMTEAQGHSQNAEDWAEKAQNAISKVSYIGDNGHWFAWDAEKNEFYDTGFKAQSGSTVYLGDNPPEDADVWIYPDGEADFDDGGVGQATENNGEIFNDYDSNRALYTNNHAEGTKTTAGFTGYKMLKITANGEESLDIEVRDKDLVRKASSAYAVGDVINFEAQLHWAQVATINSFSASADGNTVINVTYFTQHGLDASDDEAENWLSVTGKEGGEPIAQYHSAHAEGEGTIAAGRSAHAEGRNTKVIGNHGHAEGRSTIAGYAAHAEGNGSQALADASHAEGNSKATGMRAHAENSNTEARGAYSHSEGLYTVAASGSQHVQGKYNEIDSSGKYAHIVGCGTGTAEEDRKNIHTLDWNGSGWFAGDVTVGENKDKLVTEAELSSKVDTANVLTKTNTTSYTPSSNYHPTTKKYVDDKITSLSNTVNTKAGLKTSSGEIFNDYTNNKAITAYTHAEGYRTLAGNRSFKILSVLSTNQLQLDSVAGLEDGDVISYSVYVSGDGVLSPGWTPLNDATTITAIDTANKTITVSGVDSRLTTEIITNHSSSGYVGLWVNEKPEAGTISGSGYGHAEGIRTKAISTAAHSEGTDTVASGIFSHAEGNGSVASGDSAHAEGSGCLARGMRSHAEGGDTEARGSYSHSEGWHTITKGTAQHAEGIANEEMDSDYLHIVGNGSVVITDGVKTVNRSNAYTLDKNGNGWYAGMVEAEGIILRSSTEGSSKRFLLTIDDEGTLKSTEVK